MSCLINILVWYLQRFCSFNFLLKLMNVNEILSVEMVWDIKKIIQQTTLTLRKISILKVTCFPACGTSQLKFNKYNKYRILRIWNKIYVNENSTILTTRFILIIHNILCSFGCVVRNIFPYFNSIFDWSFITRVIAFFHQAFALNNLAPISRVEFLYNRLL